MTPHFFTLRDFPIGNRLADYEGMIIEKEPLVDYLLFNRKVKNTNSLTALQDIFEILNIENVDRDMILSNLRISEKYK